MPRGISVHVGVNKTAAPNINVEELEGCVNDAKLMHKIARDPGIGFTGPDVILDKQATYERVVGEIENAATQLKEEGDFFLFTFSGHGTSRGAQFSGDELDAKDETIVLYDRLLIDNVFRYLLWPKFDPRVRIFVVSDSCHSGGAFFIAGGPTDGLLKTRMPADSSNSHDSASQPAADDEVVSGGSVRFRDVPTSQVENHIESLPEFYEPLKAKINGARDLIKASSPPTKFAKLLFLAACDEGEQTEDRFPHGVFTQALKNVWEAGFSGSYADFRDKIQTQLQQTPVLGPKEMPADFVAQRPFKI